MEKEIIDMHVHAAGIGASGRMRRSLKYKIFLRSFGVTEKDIMKNGAPQTGIASPVFYSLKLSPRKLISIFRIGNPWDKDVALKMGIGFPEEIFENAASVLRIKNRDSMITVSMRGEND